MPSEVNKIRRTFLLTEFLHTFPISFIFPVYVLFLKDNGLSLIEIGIINTSYMFLVFLLEIPTGVIADVVSRKLSIVIGTGLYILAPLIYFFSSTFIWFLMAELTIGLGMCFVSGALEAWVKDKLDETGEPHNLGELYSQYFMVKRICVIIGGTLGGLVAIYGMRSVWLIAGIGEAIGFVIILFVMKDCHLNKPDKSLKSSLLSSMKSIACDSISFGWQNKLVLLLIMVATCSQMSGQALNMQWSLQAEKYFDLKSITPIWLGISTFMFLGAWWSKQILNDERKKKSLIFWSNILAGIPILIIAYFFNGWIIFSGFMISEFGRGVFPAAQKAYVQNLIPADKRATITSFDSMIQRLGMGIAWLSAGWIAQMASIEFAWLLSGIGFILTAMLSRKLPNGH